VVALDARTGRVVGGEHPGSAEVRADTERWRAEANVTWSRVVGDSPDCHRAPSRPLGDLVIGLLACAESAEDFDGYSGLSWAEDGPVDFALVAVDPAVERELWRREWSAVDGGRATWSESLTGSRDPIAVLEPGPGLAPIGLDPVTGAQVLDFPEDLFPWEGGSFGPVRLQADTSGLVVVAETDEATTRLQRSTPAGETVAAVVLDEVPFADTVPRRAAVLDDMVLLPVGRGHEQGLSARVLAVPLPGSGGGGAEAGGATDLGAYPLVDVLPVPGAAVVVVGDEYGPTGLRGLLP
jgi:hypothetical protein